MEKKEEQKEINLENEFKEAMKEMMGYLSTTNPKKIEDLREIYDLVENYQQDPDNYLKKEIPIEYYIGAQKSVNWIQRRMKNMEVIGESVKDSLVAGVTKVSQVFK